MGQLRCRVLQRWSSLLVLLICWRDECLKSEVDGWSGLCNNNNVIEDQRHEMKDYLTTKKSQGAPSTAERGRRWWIFVFIFVLLTSADRVRNCLFVQYLFTSRYYGWRNRFACRCCLPSAARVFSLGNLNGCFLYDDDTLIYHTCCWHLWTMIFLVASYSCGLGTLLSNEG